MAAKKKATAKKKAAPKKKVASKKASSPKTKKPVKVQEQVVERELDFQQEDSNDYSPSYTPSTTPEKSGSEGGNSVFRFLIIAAIILVAVIAYTQFFSNGSKESGEKLSESKPATPTQPIAKPVESVPAESEKAPEPKSTSSGSLSGFASDKIADGKTYAEAAEYCKGQSLSLPSTVDLKKLTESDTASLGKNLVVWTNTSGLALKYSFSTGKGLKADPAEKLSVLCKE
jgi:hypothetical protein